MRQNKEIEFDCIVNTNSTIEIQIPKGENVIDVELADKNLKPIQIDYNINTESIDIDTMVRDEKVDAEFREYIVAGGKDAAKLEDLKFDKDIICAGKYTQVGNITKDLNGTVTIPAKGKNIIEILDKIFTQELQPAKIEPSVSISLNPASAQEVGKTITPIWSANFSKGSYTYDINTGVNLESWSIKDNNDNTSTLSNGSFPSILITDDTRYKVTATATHTEGNIAHTNLGNTSDPEVKIAGGSKTASTSTLTGYRAFFYGILTTGSNVPLTSDIIRGLTNGGNYNSAKTVTVKVNGVKAKRIVVAIPSSSTRSGITLVNKTDGLLTDITSTYILQSYTVNVDDARGNGNNAAAYKIWIYEPASIDIAEIHDIYLG